MARARRWISAFGFLAIVWAIIICILLFMPSCAILEEGERILHTAEEVGHQRGIVEGLEIAEKKKAKAHPAPNRAEPAKPKCVRTAFGGLRCQKQ